MVKNFLVLDLRLVRSESTSILFANDPSSRARLRDGVDVPRIRTRHWGQTSLRSCGPSTGVKWDFSVPSLRALSGTRDTGHPEGTPDYVPSRFGSGRVGGGVSISSVSDRRLPSYKDNNNVLFFFQSDLESPNLIVKTMQMSETPSS